MPEMPTATERTTTDFSATRTPGPWRLESRSTKCECGSTDHGTIGYIKADGIRSHEIAVIYMLESHEADAQLMVAAPDLLEAAKLAYLRLPTTAGNADALDALARAIAKAAGAL